MIQRDQWLEAKRKYIYTDVTQSDIAKELGITRQGVILGFKREFPGVDLTARKKFEKSRKLRASVEKKKDRRQIEKLRVGSAIDEMDERHLSLINHALDLAQDSLENGTLKPKDIKDIKELVNMERMIANKRTSGDKVIIIRPEQPEDVGLPVIDAEYEEL